MGNVTRVHPALMAGGLSTAFVVGFFGDSIDLLIAASLIGTVFIVLRAQRLALLLFGSIGVLFCFSTLLWIFVEIDFGSPQIMQTLGVIFEEDARSLRLARACVVGLALSSAFAIIPDGDAYYRFRAMKLGHSVSLAMSNAITMSRDIGSLSLKAQTAFRSAGLQSNSLWGRIRALPKVITAVWMASLHRQLTRSDNVWDRNGLNSALHHSELKADYSILLRDSIMILCLYSGAVAIILAL